MHPTLHSSFSSLRHTALFIDRLADLIPSKFLQELSTERVDVRYLKKAEREAAKEEFKRKFKEVKRQKLDPGHATGGGTGGGTGASKSTIDSKSAIRKKNGVEKKVKQQQAAHVDTETEPTVHGNRNEALRLKLQKRLEEMRKQRKADETKDKVNSAKEWKDGALGVGRKKAAAQQRQAHRQKMCKAGKLDKDSADGFGVEGTVAENQRKNRGIEGRATKGKRVNAELQQNDFSFGKLEFGGSDGHHQHGKKKGKPSKQDILEQVEKDQQRVLTKAEEKTKAWKAALARAHGDKVLDDAKMLRKSIKKDAKSAEKKQKAWADRLEKVKEQKIQKQQKRKANLQSRIDAKREKKIQRREKKLAGSNRAGFEGRKSTPIKKGH